MNELPAVDAYVDDLLCLGPTAANDPALAPVAPSPAPLPEAANEAVAAPVAAVPAPSPTQAITSAIEAELLAEMDSDPAFGAAPAKPTALDLEAELLAEMDSDPAFGAAPAKPLALDLEAELLAEMDSDPAFGAAPAKPLALDLEAELLAEMDSDPAFAAAPVQPPALDLEAELLAEMDSDPAFAAAPAQPAALDLEAELLAEMDSDPAFTGGAPSPVVAAPAPVAAAIAPAAFAPPAGFETHSVEPQAPAPPATSRWLLMCIGADHYALELLRIQEVVRIAPIMPMRGTHRRVLGVMNLRGRIVPVVDLGLWLNKGQVDRSDEQARIAVVERGEDLLGVLVSRVNDVASIPLATIEPAAARGAHGEVRGVARLENVPTVLLDADALFTE